MRKLSCSEFRTRDRADFHVSIVKLVGVQQTNVSPGGRLLFVSFSYSDLCDLRAITSLFANGHSLAAVCS